MELAPNASTAVVMPTVYTSPGRTTGRGRSTSASAKLEMAQFAPMPVASESTATMVKPGLAASMRTPYLMACQTRSHQAAIVPSLDGDGGQFVPHAPDN